MYKERKGEKFTTNQGYEITIIEDLSSVHKLIEFNDKRKTRLVRDLVVGMVIPKKGV